MAAPKIEATVVDINPKTVALTGNSGKLIKYYSTAYASMVVTAQGNSPVNMDTYAISNGSNYVYGETSATFENVSKRVFHFAAKDADDNYGSTSLTPEMIDYVKLTCAITNSRPEADGTMRLSCTGSYFNGGFGKVTNTLTVKYSYESNRSSGKGTMTVDKDGNTYTAYADLNDLDYEETYTFTITAEDELAKVTSSESGVTSLPLFHWGKNNFTFEVPVTFNGDVCFNGDVDGDFTDNSNSVDTDYGYWIPRFSNYNAVEKYRTQEGWYQRLGNVITIGWHLKAIIEQGYSGKELKITFDTGELPKPSVSAFGGGVAFNIRTESDFIFEGWCINTNGEITARLQRCEKASTGELQIASTCYYPDVPDDATTDEKTVTVAGTICYMTDD